jgi:LuxR family quorum sensing-dependent transcriptional regulator
MSYAISPVVTEAFQAIEEFGRLNDPDAVLERLGGYLARFGFTSFLVTGLPTQRERLEPYILLNGWPVGWFSRYAEAYHYRHDPCVRHCFQTIEPFTWSELPPDLLEDPAAQRVMDESKEFGLVEGLCVPLHDVFGSQAVVTMAGRQVDLPPDSRKMIHLASLYAYGAAERAVRSRCACHIRHAGGLTPRERDVLSWVAWGKTAKDVGQILEISEFTVHAHLRSVKEKLGTRNNVHSVVEALRRREIRL